MSSTKSLAIIAGVGSGTGQAVANAFAKKGYEIALLARTKETLDKVADSIKQDGGSVGDRFIYFGYVPDALLLVSGTRLCDGFIRCQFYQLNL